MCLKARRKAYSLRADKENQPHFPNNSPSGKSLDLCGVLEYCLVCNGAEFPRGNFGARSKFNCKRVL